jgi:hypothetical protein
MNTTTETRTVHFSHSEDGTVFVESLGRTFRNFRCFTRHFRDLRHVVLVPTVRVSLNRVRVGV